MGSHLVSSLLKKGSRVRALYRNAIPYSHPAIDWVSGDILDVAGLDTAMQGVEQVYHCAGMVSFDPRNKKELYQVNVEGTANVVNACIGANQPKLLFVSSVAALGRIREGEPVHEGMQWSEETGNSEYGKTKYLAEMEVWRGIGEGLNAVIVNPVIILGCGDWAKGSSGIFKSAYDEFPWYTTGVSGFVDVMDLVNAMILLMEGEAAAERFIISAENLPYRTVFSEIAGAFGKKPPRKEATPLLAEIAWRMEWLKGKLSGKVPLLTRETSGTAQAKVYFDNSKLLKQLPGFEYAPVKTSVRRIAGELKEKYGL